MQILGSRRQKGAQNQKEKSPSLVIEECLKSLQRFWDGSRSSNVICISIMKKENINHPTGGGGRVALPHLPTSSYF